MSTEFQPYLDQVTRHVERDPGLVFEIQSELRTHLECAADEFESQGFSRQEAVEESLKAFGDPADLALEFKATYGNRPALGQGLRFVALWLAFPLAFLAVHLAWTGLREAWWHETSGHHGAKTLVTNVTLSPLMPPDFLPDQPDEYRILAWRLTRDSVGKLPGSKFANARQNEQAVQDALKTKNIGIYHAVDGVCHIGFFSHAFLRPDHPREWLFLPLFEPWSLSNHHAFDYWQVRRREKIGGYPPLDQIANPQEYLTRALAAPAIGDTSAAFWQKRLSQETPTGFEPLVRAFGARYASHGLALTVFTADHFIRVAEARAAAGDIESAKKILDDVDTLLARHMAEQERTRAILPLAVFRFVFLSDYREGVLGDKAGPGSDPAALSALNRELKLFESPMYLPGIKPGSTPLPPGGWAQLCGWSNLINNFLAAALACMVIVLALVWALWAVAALFDAGHTPALRAPGLIPRPVTRVALPAALLLWAAIALFYAGLFANPAMRMGPSVWMSYPLVILATSLAYLFVCAAVIRRHIRLKTLGSANFQAHAKSRLLAYISLATLPILFFGIAIDIRTHDFHAPRAVIVVCLMVLAFWGIKSTFLKLDDANKAWIFIQLRSLRLSLGLAVAFLALACILILGVEYLSSWAAWHSDALNQPLSDTFKSDVLGH